MHVAVIGGTRHVGPPIIEQLAQDRVQAQPDGFSHKMWIRFLGGGHLKLLELNPHWSVIVHDKLIFDPDRGVYNTAMSEPIPTFGDVNGKVLQAEQVSIHGDVYYDLVMQLEGQMDQGVKLRIPNHLCKRPPVAGDLLTLNFLMQQVNSVAFADRAGP